MNKPQIIQAGLELGVDYSLTISCYQPDMNGLACGICDSCRLRKIGFEQGGIPDPTLYL
jgi:7-cyano-7-deazaguanine synthase